MLERIPLTLFYEWLDFAQVEPFGERRADLRAGIIASVMANCSRGKGVRPFKPQDFMPEFEHRVRRQSDKEMKTILSAFTAAHNAYEEQGKRRRGRS